MSTSAVIGLQFGDEGKGIVTDYLCSMPRQARNKTLVVRFSGGHQAGHTVVHKGIRHVFSNFGSGTLRGVPTFFSHLCTVSPYGIEKEYKVLKEKGITPNLYIDVKCPVVTPYDEHFNRILETDNNHGSCGVGFGTTMQREEDHYHLTVDDLFYPSVLRMKMQNIAKHYGHCGIGDMGLEDFYSACNFLTSCPAIKFHSMTSIPIGFDNYIFEGSQGLLLDQDIGFFPNVTRSNTGSKNIQKLLSSTAYLNTHFYIVTRAYQTRHGNGPMTNEDIPHNIEPNPRETNVTNKWQGDFRRTLLDLDLLTYALSKDTGIINRTLVITCMDHMKNEWRFTHGGKIVNCDSEEDFIRKVYGIIECKNVLISRNEDSSFIINE